MQQIKIVVWDNIGNTLLGVQPWDSWDERNKADLVRQRPDARESVVGFKTIFKDFDVELVWLYDDEKSKLGFRDFITGYRPHARPMDSIELLIDEVRDADVLIAHKESVPPEAIAQSEKLQMIAHLGEDYRGIPVEAAEAREVRVSATPLVNYTAVAEHAWAMILSHMKRLPAIRRRMDSREYVGSWGRVPGISIVEDQVLGLVGFGEIARPIAKVAQAFRMKTIYWDIVRFPELEREFGVEYAEWDDVFSSSDVLSVQLALNDQTRGIIGARELSLMKPTSLFMNTARGKLVDQPALVEAIRTGQIGGAALEVFAEEPLPPDDPLLDLHARDPDRVILTPHCGSQSPWTWVRDSQELWFEVLRGLRNEPLRFEVRS